jgi:hypothetical protein
MSLHYDDKGKFYTEFVAKNSIEAVIQTVTNRIDGCIYVRTGERVSDELNRSAQFLAVTDATIYDLNGKELYRSPFMTINRDQIVWLMPEEKAISQTPDG